MNESKLYNLNIERAVLSAITFEPDIFKDIGHKLEPQDFYLPFHQHVFKAMQELEKEQKPIDEEFIRVKLINKKEFDEEAMLNLLSANPISNHDAYTEDIRERRKMRDLEKLSNEIRKNTHEGEESSEDIISSVSKKIEAIDKNQDNEASLPSLADEIKESIEKARNGESPYFAKTGLFNLDNFIGGWRGQRLIIVAGRPSLGKTALAVTLIGNLFSSNVPIRCDSLEMSSKEMLMRLVSFYTADNLFELEQGMVKNDVIFFNTLNRIVDSNLITIVDETGITVDKIINKAKRDYRKKPFKVWFVDHLRYIKISGKDRHDLEVGYIVKAFKKFAKEFGVDVVLLSQINRDTVNRKG